MDLRILALLLIFLCGVAAAQEQPAKSPTTADRAPTTEASGEGYWNLALETGGGRQFWTDQAILAKWRIQKNSVTGHCRLLDPFDVRQAWGTLAECEAKLEAVRRDKKLAAPRGKVVIAIHGILRSRHQLQPLCDWLEKEGGYEVVNFNYASSRAEIGEHAEALAKIIAQCDDATEINFVGHSMGNIVLRHYLGDCASGKHGLKPNDRIKRIVMLGPPNNGAELAKRFRDNKLFQAVWGRSGLQLADDWTKMEEHLATPSCEFGIIAGGLGTKIGLNPLVAGDDDGVVAVEETKLPGACDFLVAPVMHGDLMDDTRTRAALLRFLRDGCFISAEKRNALPAATAKSETRP